MAAYPDLGGDRVADGDEGDGLRARPVGRRG
jgi:hypothetical protein